MQAAPPAIYSHTGPLLGWNMAGCHLAARVSSPLAAIPQRAHAAWGEKCLEREPIARTHEKHPGHKGQWTRHFSYLTHSREVVVSQFTRSVMSESLWLHGLQHARPPCPSTTPRAYSNACPLSWWCHPTISFSVVPFSSCLQSFPAPGSFLMSQFFASGGQSIGVSASTSVLPMNIQDLFPLGLTGWISLQSKWLARVFSNTTVQEHQFFGTQLSL